MNNFNMTEEYIVGDLALLILVIIAKLLRRYGRYTLTKKTIVTHPQKHKNTSLKRYQRKHKALHKCAERSRHRKKSEYIQACWDEVEKPRNR